MRYGIIGNCKTAALVHESGSIDWCCFPKFDSPSVFARILDPNAGHFRVSPVKAGTIRQSYIPQTAILQTEFDDGENAFVAIDFMPRYRAGETYRKSLEIFRILKPIKGRPRIRVSFQPRLNYNQGKTQVLLENDKIRGCHGLEDVCLYASLPLQKIFHEEEMDLEQDHFLLMTYHERFSCPTKEYAYEALEKTREYWEGWSEKCRLPSLYSDAVLRSAITLKLLTYEETGAVVAAATTSLPESIGEERNWDYRFCWLRDASMMLESLKSIGHFEEAKGFIHFLLKTFESKQSKVQILYTIDGGTELREKSLPNFQGYKNSLPVRIGNNACYMIQNDIFGEVLNAIYLYYIHYGIEEISEDVWSLVKFLVNTVARDWKERDAGIWEFRRRKKHFTHSKILSWAALDCGSKIAKKLGRDATHWSAIAEEVKRDIHKRGWSKKMGAFTQHYGSEDLDASILQSLRYGFLDASDERWIATVRACEKSLMRDDFTFRYTNIDDFGKPKSAFIVSSLWMVKALHTIGEKEKALRTFEKILSHANHLGLLSEDIDVGSGELVGNFPQAYSHMALINTANLLSGKMP